MKKVLLLAILFFARLDAVVTIHEVFSIIMSHEFSVREKIKILNAYKVNHIIEMDQKYPVEGSAITEIYSPLGLILCRSAMYNDPDHRLFKKRKEMYARLHKREELLLKYILPGCDLDKPAIHHVSFNQVMGYFNEELSLEDLQLGDDLIAVVQSEGPEKK